MRKFFLFFFIIISTSLYGQSSYYNKIFNPNIKTVLMYSGDDDLSLPVWDLGSRKSLTFSFDDLTTDWRDYYYTIIHCNSDWTPSNLDQSEYMDGYFENQITEYQSSFNTTQNYIHYTVQIPNEYMRPLVSGNYILKVYEGSNPDSVVLFKRFMVIERMTEVDAISKNMNQGAYFYNDQELEIVVNYYEKQFYDISQNLKVQVLKNRNWIESIELTQPDLIKGTEFTFNNFTKLKFKGGNEFHHFNTKDIYHYLENIENISFVDNTYHFKLTENKDRTFQEYVYKPDLNGLFKVDVSGSDLPSTEADYSFVYFTLKMEAPMQTGEIYVWGGLTNYEFVNTNKMHYNFEQKVYECRLFLKQGYYNYQYVVLEKAEPDLTFIEGNHSKTQNLYTILVYYHDFRKNYDRLIGVNEISSVVK